MLRWFFIDSTEYTCFYMLFGYNCPCKPMKFYIVTPTYNSIEWLQRCVRSVADQIGDGHVIHHHVQDGGSTDATAAWLAEWQQSHSGRNDYIFTYESAADRGMYDAINIAWSKMPADADITAHLNSDEQYLPGALAGVATAAQANPHADILVTSHLVVDAKNRYICHRWPTTPAKWISRSVCEIITCSCFHRAEPFRRHGIRFDEGWRSIGDFVLYRDIVNTGVRVQTVPDLLAVAFAVTGNNLGWSEITDREWERYRAQQPAWELKTAPLARLVAKFKRRLPDFCHSAPRSYSLYSATDCERTDYTILRPTSHWGCRTEGERS